jgi:hypothetical protein
MSERREELIKDLVSDLKPVRGAGRSGSATAIWLAIAAAYSAAILYATGPWRAGAFGALAAEPLFAIETLLAAGAITLLARAALRSAIPGVDLARELMWPALLLGGWIGIYVLGFWYPAHPVSMLGKREHCVWQTVLFGLPSLALMLGVARRYLPLWPRTTGLVAGAASASIPAALMQFACMYVPSHILTHHIGPIALVAVLGMGAGRFALRGRRTVPRGRAESVH